MITKSDLNKMDKHYRNKFVNSLSGFKSANLIGSADINGATNLCVVSSCFHLGADPALMGFIMRPHSIARHTLENIMELGQYTINHIREEFYLRAHQTSARFEKEESEFVHCQLGEKYTDDFNAPFVAESWLSIGLSLRETKTLEVNNTVLVIGEIEHVLIANTDSIAADGHIDLESLGSLCVSGLDSYHDTRKLGRLNYAKKNIKPHLI